MIWIALGIGIGGIALMTYAATKVDAWIARRDGPDAESGDETQ